ncbi:hypothetical protein KSW81_006394 [Nannochloris sp. 'desiccata']|nr:hypothetical protein KSW81_006394 [Chlorella desiccata (nom. nud.)]
MSHTSVLRVTQPENPTDKNVVKMEKLERFHSGDMYVLEVPVGYGIFVRKVLQAGEVIKAGMPSIVGPFKCDDGLDELVAVPGDYGGMRGPGSKN